MLRRCPLPSTPSKARTASVIGLSVSSSGSSGGVTRAVPVEAASLTASSTAGHQAVARRLIEGGSDMVRWNSVRRSARAR